MFIALFYHKTERYIAFRIPRKGHFGQKGPELSDRSMLPCCRLVAGYGRVWLTCILNATIFGTVTIYQCLAEGLDDRSEFICVNCMIRDRPEMQTEKGNDKSNKKTTQKRNKLNNEFNR